MKKKYIQLAIELMRARSTASSKSAHTLVQRCKRKLDRSFNVSMHENSYSNSCFVSNNITKKKPRIILNAHLDVVPGKKEQFTPKIVGDRLYGRGAYDMKAAAAVMIHVFNDVAQKVSYPLGLQLVSDEETGGFHGTKYQIDKGVRAEFVISGEPTNFEIKHQAKGIIWAKILFGGIAAHAAYPWNGDNAIVKAHEFVQSLLRTYPTPKKQSWKTTVNVSSIKTTNTTSNVVPSDCTLLIDIRFIPEDQEKVLSDIKRLLPKKAKILDMTIEPSHDTKKDSPFIKSLKNSARAVTGVQPSLTRAMGASDLRHYSRVGVPGVEFGPAGAGHHTDREWVSIKSLSDYYEILKHFLMSLDK